MKTLLDGYWYWAKKGDIFNKEQHLFTSNVGDSTKTLCGRPMLGNNHCDVTADHNICSHCLDEYYQQTGTKPDNTIKECIEFTMMLPVKVQMYPGDFETEKEYEEAKVKAMARDEQTINELFWENLESEEIIDEANRNGVADNKHVRVAILNLTEDDPGLRPAMVELTPDELKWIMDHLPKVEEGDADYTPPGLWDKLEQAADQSIVGD